LVACPGARVEINMGEEKLIQVEVEPGKQTEIRLVITCGPGGVEVVKEKKPKREPAIPSAKVCESCEYWNAHVAHLLNAPQVVRITESRAKHLRARLREMPDLWEQVVYEARLTDRRCLGYGDGAIRFIDFDWLTKSPTNLSKFLEGKYRRKDAANVPTNGGVPEKTEEELHQEYLAEHPEIERVREEGGETEASFGF
jgi:hypothetical protein